MGAADEGYGQDSSEPFGQALRDPATWRGACQELVPHGGGGQESVAPTADLI